MRKNKIYLLISIITLICFFGTAALCNQCAADTVEEIDNTVAEDEVTEEEPPGEEDAEEEEVSEEEEEIEEETPEQEEQKETPAITIEIYEGPIYSSADHVCYYRIKANVTGTPTPDIEFSKDDSDGSWGKFKTQVNLESPSDTYTLIASATNSEGSATDSIDLSWGCNTNNPPEISDLFISPGTKFTGSKCDVIVTASDLDGDSLNYKWSADGGYFDNITIPDTEWIAPNTSGTYNITIIVGDGKGGVDTKTITVEIESSQTPNTVNKYIPIVSGEGGRSCKSLGDQSIFTKKL